MHQVVKMSVEEQKEMYRKVKKEKLIEMLISANANLDLISRPLEVYLESKKIRPSLPPLPPNRLISNNGKRVIPKIPKEDRNQISEGDNEPNYELIGAVIFGFGSVFGMFMFYLIMLMSTK